MRFDRARQVERLRELAAHLAAFPEHIDGFTLVNGYYEAFDAEVLWAMLRDLRPGRDSAPASVRRVAAQDEPEDVFTALEAGDVLFVDTTHTVKTGGEELPLSVLAAPPRVARRRRTRSRSRARRR